MSATTVSSASRAAQLRARIDDRTAVVGIIGLGYVGLPLALTFTERQFRVLGFDVDRKKVDALHSGDAYIRHLDWGRVTNAASSGKLQATSDFQRLSEPDVLIVCVPTPLTPQREPDMSYVEGTARLIAKSLRP